MTAAATATEPAVSKTAEKPSWLVSETAIPSSTAPEFASYDTSLTAAKSSASPVFVIICIVLLILIAGGIAGTVYLQRQGKAKTQQTAAEASQPSTVSNSTSGSSTPVPAPSPAASVMPVPDSIRAMNLGNYPGATPVAIATLSGETVVAGFLTRDTPTQVMQFYRVRFPVSTASQDEGKSELSATLAGGERIRIQAQPQGTNTQVMVLQEK